jgi:LemA protein
MKRTLLVVVVVLLAMIGGGLLWYVSTRNSLVSLEENVEASWGQVQNVYQRRLDLIPNLVETVKGYASHESATLEAVVNARARAGGTVNMPSEEVLNNPEAFQRFQESQQALSSSLQRLLFVVERYPDLKANQNFLNLQAQLEGTENRIAVERNRFNEVVRDYNTRIRQFPAQFVANSMGLEKRPYFEAEAAAQEAPKVRF